MSRNKIEIKAKDFEKLIKMWSSALLRDGKDAPQTKAQMISFLINQEWDRQQGEEITSSLKAYKDRKRERETRGG